MLCVWGAAERGFGFNSPPVVAIFAVDGAFTESVEDFPGGAPGSVHPGLIRTRVAAGRRLLLVDGPSGICEAASNCGQFRIVIDLDTEMVDQPMHAAARDREVDAWIVEDPFRVVGLAHGWLR